VIYDELRDFRGVQGGTVHLAEAGTAGTWYSACAPVINVGGVE